MSSRSPAILDLMMQIRSGRMTRREVLRRGLALGLSSPVIIALLAACGGDDDDQATEVTTDEETEPSSDQQAEISNESARSFLLDSTWPGPLADLWRTSAVSGAGLPEDVTSEDLVATTAEVAEVPFFGITDSDNNAYVLGGSPFVLDLFTEAQAGDPADKSLSTFLDLFRNFTENVSTTPYVAKIDPETMDVKTVELPKGLTTNYIGGLLAHQNERIYAVATATLFEIDPESLEITRSLNLPKIEGARLTTTYNGLTVNPGNGDIILKAVDFSGRTADTVLMSVNPEDMTIRTQTPSEVGTARMSIARQGDSTYLYMPGPTTTLRFIVTDEGFEADTNWSETYRSDDDGTTQGPSMLFMGEYGKVVFSSNGTIIYGVTAPLMLYTQSATTDDDTLTTDQATSNDIPGGAFFMVAGDPYKSGIIVAEDTVNKTVAGWQMSDDGSVEMIWETDQFNVSAGPAIAVDQGHLYLDDRQCAADGTTCTTYLVVADLQTGEELARVEVAATLPTMGHIFLAEDAVFFIASEAGESNGLVTRISTN